MMLETIVVGALETNCYIIADHFRPKWLVWENVPGVVSSNAGKDFTSFGYA